jgi:hypothetical protein
MLKPIFSLRIRSRTEDVARISQTRPNPQITRARLRRKRKHHFSSGFCEWSLGWTLKLTGWNRRRWHSRTT